MNYKDGVAFYTVFRKECQRIVRIWPQTLLPTYLMAMMYLFIFGQILGSRIGAVDGVAYVRYLAPGLIMMVVIINAYSNTSYALFSEKFCQSIEALMLSPIRPVCLIAAFVLAAVCRSMLVGCFVWLFIFFLGFGSIVHPLLLIMALLLTAIIFALVGMINAFYARTYDGIAFVPHVLLLPLIYLGGVFYPLHQLPVIWKMLSMINPIAYLIDVARFAMLGQIDFSLNLAWVVSVMVIVVLYWWCYTCQKNQCRYIQVGHG